MFNTLTVRTWDLMIPRPSRVLVTNPDRQLPCHFSKTVLRIPSKRRRIFLAGLGFAALQLAGCAAKPQTTPDYVLTYADNQPAGYPTTHGAQYFADLVQQQTGGKVVIQVKANGEYGSEQQGKTIRVQDSQIVIDMIRLLGAVPETTAYSDVYSALETGQVDAAENNWPAYYSMEHYKVARYYMTDEHSRVPEVQLASGRTWDALPEEYRQILQACARASAQYERQRWAQEETAARKAAIAGGCFELPLPEEEMQNFRQLVQPLYRKYCADYLPLVEEIQAE